MTDQGNDERQPVDRVALPLDPETALRALLAVDPRTDLVPVEQDQDDERRNGR